MRPPKGGTVEEKDRFESTEPKTDDVEGHRFKDDPERNAGEVERNKSDRLAGEDDFEAHRLQGDRNSADRNSADRNSADRNSADRNSADQANL
jgi:hypothetical protein